MGSHHLMIPASQYLMCVLLVYTEPAVVVVGVAP